jgi:hypothetical protein
VVARDPPAQLGRTEADPVARDEYLLRRIHYRSYEERPRHQFQRGGFSPSSDDKDGLSVFRALFCSVRELVRAARKPPTEYYVVRLRARDLLNAGFTLVPNPQPSPVPPGHTLIPEITCDMPRAERSPREATLTEVANDPQRSQIAWRRQAL